MPRPAPLLAALAAFAALAASAAPPADGSPAPASAGAPAAANATAAATAALEALFAESWERQLREGPEQASALGDRRYDDRWTDLSPAALAAAAAAERADLARVRAIDRAALPAAARLDRDLFEWLAANRVEAQRFREELEPITHQSGVQLADGLVESLPFAGAGDYRAWLLRLRALPALVDQTIALMRQGLAAGRTPPRVLLERVTGQLAAQVVADPAESPFYRPFERLPPAVGEPERAALAAEARQVIAAGVVPAFRRLSAVFASEYLPRARATVAATDRPDGKAWYDHLVRTHTTTELGAEEIHALGLREVARLRARMEALQAEVGFQGDLQAFFRHLRTDPRFFYPTPEALLEGYRALAKRVDPELVKVSHLIPRLPYGVRAIPAHLAKDATTAYYSPGALDGSRAGTYFVNLYRPEARPRWEMVPLTLHEAVPGHHFQFARSGELGALPPFRRVAYFTACGEGWALYAEQLGYDMGLYDDPYDRFGQVTYEMWRAVRLVVDTGLHAKGWSRRQAIEYFTANAPKTEQDIVNEVDRYLGSPGQALGYKIGQLRISALRARAAEALGARFDLGDFDDEVLSVGSVPIAILERHLEGWIEARRAAR